MGSLTTKAEERNSQLEDDLERARRHAVVVPLLDRLALVADGEVEAAVVGSENVDDAVPRARDPHRAPLARVARARLLCGTNEMWPLDNSWQSALLEKTSA